MSNHDDYAWLRDSSWPDRVDNPKIIDYLNKENEYTEKFFQPLQAEKDKIFEELKSRIKLDDQSLYIKKGANYYYTRMESDKEHPIYCRKLSSIHSREEIILDVNLLAKNNEFTEIGNVSISLDQTLMAYSIDSTGDEKYKIKIYNFKTKQYLNDEIEGASSSIVFHEQLNGFFYVAINENRRNDKVKFHYLGTEASQDITIFHTTNHLYQVDIGKSKSDQYIFIDVHGYHANEIYILPLTEDDFTPKLVRKLEDTIFYDIEHNKDYFYIKTNYKAKNFRIIQVKTDELLEDAWENSYIGGEDDKYLSSIDVTDNYLILNYRHQGLPFIKIKNLITAEEKIVNFPDPAFEARAKSAHYLENDIRINYSSLARPNTTYNYDFENEKLSILKQQEIPCGFISEEYKVERIWADNQGIRIPVTVFYKKSTFKQDGSNPLYLGGYGSYGIAMPVSFRNSAVSLVDRGFVYALAHIRGGDELGHDWYESAKFLNKKRTFEDFIAVSEHLIKNQYTSKGNIVISGGSAGGMLIGVAINERPELYKAAIAHVPFVDVLNTMLDETLPLTPGEFKEWGNPKEIEYFNYIKSYSPYDNIKKQPYPCLFVTAGLSDPRVGYWEAAKLVARLRANKLDNNILLLKTNMTAGHKGAAGRFDYLKEVADEIVFITKIFR